MLTEFDRLGLSAFPHIECLTRSLPLPVLYQAPYVFSARHSSDARYIPGRTVGSGHCLAQNSCSVLNAAPYPCAQLKLLTSRPLRYNARALIVLAWSARQS